jgi:hypothetical protein
VKAIHDFFEELDAERCKLGGGAIELDIIGASALALQTGYDRGTKDSDVLESANLSGATRAPIELPPWLGDR